MIQIGSIKTNSSIKILKKIIIYPLIILLLSIPIHLSSNTSYLMNPIPNTNNAASFKLIGLDEQYYELKDFRGKFVLLNFWATWCHPCIEEMPSLEAAYQYLDKTKFIVIGIHAGPGPEAINHFLQRSPVTFPILIDMDLELGPPDWSIAGIPSTFLISPEGKMLYFAQGKRDFGSAAMLSFFEKLMKDYKW
tara:strand:+ start:14044 stop:14619 length:576 start_codon:yes stop_codon:yes gene_type:complete